MTELGLDDRHEAICYQRLVGLLHPGGLTCPHCGSASGDNASGQGPGGVPAYRCQSCRRSFNAWTGTLLQDACCPPSELLDELLGALKRVERRGRRRERHASFGTCLPGDPELCLPNHPYAVLPGMPRGSDS